MKKRNTPDEHNPPPNPYAEETAKWPPEELPEVAERFKALTLNEAVAATLLKNVENPGGQTATAITSPVSLAWNAHQQRTLEHQSKRAKSRVEKADERHAQIIKAAKDYQAKEPSAPIRYYREQKRGEPDSVSEYLALMLPQWGIKKPNGEPYAAGAIAQMLKGKL